MHALRFEWDPEKARANERKHGVSFAEAESVFMDDFAVLLDDADHSNGEDRFLILGISSNMRVLVVSHCYRKAADVIRIISARKATRKETDDYSRRWSS
jgi:uncharacterized DUF497 family protein